MRKFVSFMLIAFASLMANALNVKIGELYNNLDDANKTAEVCRGQVPEIVIPSKVDYNGNTYSVTSIGNYAFYYCIDLTSITIPNSVTSIDLGAFGSCTNLSTVYCYAETPPSISDTTFSQATYQYATLYVLKGFADDFKADANWAQFRNIIEVDLSGISDVIAEGAAAEIVGY